MSLSETQKQAIAEILRHSLRNKIKNYQPEPNSMPFHTRLLGKDRLALFSFIHSLNTNFGTTIFEPVARELARTRFSTVNLQYSAGDQISSQAQIEIQRIMDGLETAEVHPDKLREVETIRRVCRQGQMIAVKPTKVDLAIQASSGEYYYFDIKTAKPNAGGFKEFKRTLLEWVAATLAQKPDAAINTIVAIPYNPYEPKPYSRWTMRGMLDLPRELKVAEEFWDFLGGEGTFENLLNIFEVVGIELRPEIDQAFERFR